MIYLEPQQERELRCSYNSILKSKNSEQQIPLKLESDLVNNCTSLVINHKKIDDMIVRDHAN